MSAVNPLLTRLDPAHGARLLAFGLWPRVGDVLDGRGERGDLAASIQNARPSADLDSVSSERIAASSGRLCRAWTSTCTRTGGRCLVVASIARIRLGWPVFSVSLW